MTNVGALNYKVSSNVSEFKEGMMLSRSELALTRRAMTDSRSDAEKLAYRLDTLEKAYKAGVITQEEYTRTQQSVRDRSAEGREAARLQAEAMNEAAAITRRLMTDTEKLTQERARLDQLKPHLSEEAYARAISDLNKRLPESIEREARLKREQDQLNSEMEEGRRVTQSLENATERYQREVDDLQRLLRVGAISQDTYNRGMERTTKALKDNQIGAASQLPVIGNLIGEISTAAAMYGPWGVAIAGVTAGLLTGTAAVSAFSQKITESLEKMDAQSKAAAKIGADIEQLGVIYYAASEVAGVSTQGVDAALQKLVINTQKAADGNAKLEATYKQLGLNANQLAGQDPTVILRRVADGIQDLKNPGDQVKAVFDLMGKEAVKMVDVLRGGSDGLDDYAAKAYAFGDAFSQIDASAAEGANDALARAEKSLDRLWNQLAGDVAPSVQLVADRVSGLGTAFTMGVNSIVGTSINLFHTATAAAQGWYDTMAGIASLMAGPATWDFGQLWSGISGGSARETLDSLNAIDEANRKAAEARKTANEQTRKDQLELQKLEEQESKPKEAKGAPKQSEADRLLQAERDKANELRHGKEWLEDQKAIRAGLNEQQREELRQLRAVSAEMEKQKKAAADATAAKKQADEASKRQKEQLAQRAKAVAESVMTPFDKAVQEIAEIRAFAKTGAIDQTTASKAEQAVRDRLAKSREKEVTPGAQVAQRGSREAYQMIVESMRGQRDAELRAREEMITEQRLNREAAERTAAAVEKLTSTEAV